ncbi:MAG: copper homeostasis protein CutC [Candidatus Pseudobacter hemicellulosilyticus]|uniref:PF03932 family protein CutC n=1 Tax=Candidatus Pseudobacter hemicellulosilyticus TaxID=3121375 RepID=A0AAJ6BJR4_9BACT|nr:MAG: copper homeostasis protein CutC [Pseudobacter sp.]
MAAAKFELCAFNIQSCLIAEKLGVYRVELCDNPVEGGTTPGYGTIQRTRERISIKLYPILRPRCGNYYYDEDELAILKTDIAKCKELGCDGISIGIQRIDGTIDVEQLSRFVEWAYPMGVTCNRAFDATPDPFQALEDIVRSGCERILTSGQLSGAPEAGELLGKLVKQAGNRISIMPGAGINAGNIATLREESGAHEFHGSVRKVIPNNMQFANPLVLDYGNVYLPDEEQLTAILHALD